MTTQKDVSACAGPEATTPATKPGSEQQPAAKSPTKPVSEKQLAANRRNALRSTGPRTPEGKARAARNSLKHGLRSEKIVIPGEDERALRTFRDALTAELAPESAMEAVLAERVVACAWRLRRALRIESEAIGYSLENELNSRAFYPRAHQADPEVNVGALVWRKFGWQGSYENFRRYEAHLERALYLAFHELRMLQAVRRRCEPGEGGASGVGTELVARTEAVADVASGVDTEGVTDATAGADAMPAADAGPGADAMPAADAQSGADAMPAADAEPGADAMPAAA